MVCATLLRAMQYLRKLLPCLALCAVVPAQSIPIRPAITGIAFFRAVTTQPEEARSFYEGTLGYAPASKGQIEVYPVNPLQWIEVVHRVPLQPAVRMDAVGFTTRDAAALAAYLHARGVATTPLSGGEFSVHDPEGNLIVFVQQGSRDGVPGLVASAQPSLRAASHRMIHVGFVVHDAPKEDGFYRDILGFKPYWHGGMKPGTTDWVSLQVPDGTDWLEYMLNQPPNIDLRQTGVMDHFSLGVTHMADAVAQLKKNGCNSHDCTTTQMGKDGKVQLNVFDPDLTRVEFMEFEPSGTPCCSPFNGPQPGAEENR